RAPDARETLPRTRTQPFAADRQRFFQLAGAVVPAHGQAQAAVGSARRDRSVRRRPHLAGRTAGRVPAAGQRAHPRVRRRGIVRRRAAPALERAAAADSSVVGFRHRRATTLPSARARDARERDLHQLRARGPARGAAFESGHGRGRAHDLVRPRSPGKRRRLRSQDPRQHRALQLLRPGDFGDDAATARSLLPPRVELCGGPRAQHRGRRGVRPARLYRRHAGSQRTGSGALQGRAHDAPGGRRIHARIPAPVAGVAQRETRMNDINRVDTVTLDPENPWLGLFSYSEETRAYFHGRDEEAAELARRVQRKLLTVLFGQSGLGKTSLLRAGLVPRLRGADFCPVYVRIDYAAESPPPSAQIKQAVFRATAEAGHWTRPGSSIEGESLWEFLHHRGDLLRDAGGRTLMPLLIFDQFEEIFTLGQANDAGRLRARQF